MNPNKLGQPKDLTEAISMLVAEMSARDKEDFKGLKNGNDLHFTFGMALRNHWHLWGKDSEIVKWFLTTHNLIHADDMSGIILASLHAELNGKPWPVEELAAKYKAHWAKNKL